MRLPSKALAFFSLAAPFIYLSYLVMRYVNGDQVFSADPGKEIVLYLGEWALVMLLLTLCVTPAKQFLRLNLIPIRRMLGLFTFFYALLHLLAYSAFLLEFEFRELWADIVERPYITVGALALLLMLPLAVTSTNGMRRKLGARWKQLHRTIYLIASLVIIHFFWQTRSDFTEPLMYSAALALLLGLRVLAAKRNRPTKPVPKGT